MEIMPSTDKNFNVMAAQVLRKHLQEGDSYTQCVADVAEKEGLTPEETKRLTEKANTALSIAHLRGENKKDSFELAEYDDVMDRIATPGMEEKTASLSLPKTRRRNVRDSFEGFAKTAESNEPTFSISKETFALRRKLEELKLEKAAAEVCAHQCLEKLGEKLDKMTKSELGALARGAVFSVGTGGYIALVRQAVKNSHGKSNMEKKAALEAMDEAVNTATGYDEISPYTPMVEVLSDSVGAMEKLGEEIKETERSLEILRSISRC